MRTTLALDEELLARAQELTGTTEKTALIREALKALIQRESARRLALLAGSEPALKRRCGPRTNASSPPRGAST
ncbi:MAG: type II toxin-antitoxin system VapB family antitoxin [Burkholderiaceae bacterium]